MASISFSTRPALFVLLAVAAGSAGLVVTNPGPADFEEFAADQLTRLVSDEVCRGDGLPSVLRMLLPDCDGLVRSQRRSFGQLAWAHSQRRNLGLFSIYRTQLGGRRLLADLELPSYRATTVAVAGHFWLLQSEARGPQISSR
ncbi:MAG: DUF4359 domain-containing protein [Synechococcaceae cyanobacterium]|nr:DUF4359 domain-containing protein [Synechococcaceae cyanobacterium]